MGEGPAAESELRPFSRIVGQERAVGYLKRVAAVEKVPHAYLFCGVEGVGKVTTARAFARALNCLEQDPGGEGCGKCVHCRQLAGGNFPDLEIMAPEGRSIRIEQIRELNRRLSLKPVAARYRVVIVERAELMTVEAANAFLKTLEEPPPGNVLIMTAAEPRDLLPTILSRCQRVSFRPIPPGVLAEWLREERGASGETAEVLSRISEGSIGRAVEMLESGFFDDRDKYLDQILELKRLSGPEILSLAVDFAQKERRASSSGTGGKSEIHGVLGLWKTLLRDMMVVKATGGEGPLVHGDYGDKLQNASDHYKIESLDMGLLVLDRAQRDFLRSRNLDLIVETTLLSLKKLLDAG